MRNFTKWFKRWVIDNEYLHIAIGGFVVMALVFVAIYLLDITNVPTSFGWVSEADSKLWLDRLMAYTGTAAGAFVGFIATILAVRITIDNQEAARREDNAKAVLPLIKVKSWKCPLGTSNDLGRYDFSNDGNAIVMFSFAIKNVGQREMYDVRWGRYGGGNSCNKITPVIYRDESKDFWYCGRVHLEDEDVRACDLESKVYFIDCYGNEYYQKIKCHCVRSGESEYFNTENYEVVSAPEKNGSLV